MIPLSTPNISGNEWKYIRDCLDTGWVSSVGAYVNRFEEAVCQFTSAPHAVATSNGTTALHIALLVCGVKPGELVLAPDITFVAPVNTIRYVGADPVLVDVDPGNWQMDLDLLEDFLRKETLQKEEGCFHGHRRIGALLPVHVLGNLCDMDRLMALAKEFGIPVVEDATEAMGSRYRGTHAGCFGMMGCFSFNGNKIITTGGGGMIVSPLGDLAKRARHLTTQAKASKEEYFHDEVGYNYRLSNILAAMGLAQMEQLPSFLNKKREIYTTYNQALKSIEGIRFQQNAPDVSPNHWLYTIYSPRQSELREWLGSLGMECRPLWVPMHRLPAFRGDRFVTRNNQSDDLYTHCLSLPCSTHLSTGDQQAVIAAIDQFYHG